jgi:hypothetical protein
MEDLYWGGQGWNSALEPEEEENFLIKNVSFYVMEETSSFRTMDKAQKPRNPKYSTPSLEPFSTDKEYCYVCI